MYELYKATKRSLKSIKPKEIKLLKYLLNFTDPEERFSALETASSPGKDNEPRNPDANSKRAAQVVTIMLDAYELHKEETGIEEAKEMNLPMVIQRLSILKETIEEEYLEKDTPEAKKDIDAEVV